MGNALFQSVCITRLASKAFKLWCAIFLSASITANAESNKQDVYYGGFAFCGKASDVYKNFPISPLSTRRRMTGRRFWAGLPANFSKRTRIISAG